MLLLDSLTINEHIAVHSHYELSAVNVSTDSVEVLFTFEQSAVSF